MKRVILFGGGGVKDSSPRFNKSVFHIGPASLGFPGPCAVPNPAPLQEAIAGIAHDFSEPSARSLSVILVFEKKKFILHPNRQSQTKYSSLIPTGNQNLFLWSQSVRDFH